MGARGIVLCLLSAGNSVGLRTRESDKSQTSDLCCLLAHGKHMAHHLKLLFAHGKNKAHHLKLTDLPEYRSGECLCHSKNIFFEAHTSSLESGYGTNHFVFLIGNSLKPTRDFNMTNLASL